MDNNYNLTRRQSREAALIFFYQYLINEKIIDFNISLFMKKSIMSLSSYLEEKYDTDKQILLVENDLFVLIIQEINSLNLIKKDINSYLGKKWDFDRLSIIEQSILLMSYIQIKAKIAKTIVINEAIELAKEYCDDDSYKFINGVLDKINE